MTTPPEHAATQQPRRIPLVPAAALVAAVLFAHRTAMAAVPPCGDPSPGVGAGGKAHLSWTAGATNAKDKVSFNGSKSDAVSPPQLGDPVSGDSSYRVCIWDTPADQATPRLIYDALLPAGGRCGNQPCWKAFRGKKRRGVRFADPRRGNPAGVQALEVTTDGSCKVSWSFVAKGSALPDPVAAGGQFLQQHDGVLVEIRNCDGLLIRNRFGAATANATTRFRAAIDAPTTAHCNGRRPRGNKPNVLFVLADDLGYGDLGSYGSADIATPNLDQLANEGARFTQFYVGTSVCTPSRASLLTGRYPARMDLAGAAGVFFPFSTDGLDPAEQTIAEVLHTQGYATALIGKWHLGHLPAYLPTSQGFDRFYGLPYSNDMNEPFYPGQPPPVHDCGNLVPCRPGVPLMDGESILEMPAIQETLSKRYTEQAIAFMRSAVERDQPFFVYYATHLPHVPLYPSAEFAGRSAGGLYGDVVEELDGSVGALLREIHDLGIDDDTLVVFTSDNGPWLLWVTNQRAPEGGNDAGSAGPLRDGKSTTFEGGMRVPMIVRWPKHIPANRTIATPAAMVDWMPTLAALAGAAPPAGVELDGKDIWPLLSGGAPRDPNGAVSYLYYRQDGSGLGGFRDGRWKLKLAVTGGESLYSRYNHGDLLFDLEADPGEQHDLAAAMPEKLAELMRRMNELAAAVDPPSAAPR